MKEVTLEITSFEQMEGGEYDSNEWKTFREERGIMWKFIIPGNRQQNGSAERLDPTLLRKASAILKKGIINIKYWPEMIRTANYLRNRQPDTGKSMTPFEASYSRRPQLGHLCRIIQKGYAQDRKLSTGWKKFQDRAIKCRLLGYEGNHIYRMLMPGGSVMKYSNVAWTEILALPGSEKISSSSDPGATNIQDLSSDECLLKFLVDKDPNSPVVRLFVAPIASRPTTPFITTPSTPITPAITSILTTPITSLSSTTSSLTAPLSTAISPTLPSSIISNRPITRS